MTLKRRAVLLVWLCWSCLMLLAAIGFGLLFTEHFRNPVQWSPDQMPVWLSCPVVGVVVVAVAVRYRFLDGFKMGRQDLLTPEGVRQFVKGHLIFFALAGSLSLPGLVLKHQGYPAEFCERFVGVTLALLLTGIPLARRFDPDR